jgi:hypothetical protein
MLSPLEVAHRSKYFTTRDSLLITYSGLGHHSWEQTQRNGTRESEAGQETLHSFLPAHKTLHLNRSIAQNRISNIADGKHSLSIWTIPCQVALNHYARSSSSFEHSVLVTVTIHGRSLFHNLFHISSGIRERISSASAQTILTALAPLIFQTTAVYPKPCQPLRREVSLVASEARNLFHKGASHVQQNQDTFREFVSMHHAGISWSSRQQAFLLLRGAKYPE